MSNEEFRRELNNVFDTVSGTPSSNLRDRVRSAVAQAPTERNPYWLAGVAAVVIAALIVGVLYIANPLRRLPPAAGGPVTSPSPTSSWTAKPSPSPSLQPFVCVSQTFVPNGPVQPVVPISALRTGAHGGYDRLTVEFTAAGPSTIEVRGQTGTTFTQSPSGIPTTLKGNAGVLVVIHGSDLHTSYSGLTDIVTGYPVLAEVKRIEDFEGVVQLGLGVNGTGCYRAFFLTNPNRLVVDVQAAG